jgi:predicted small secreted protein
MKRIWIALGTLCFVLGLAGCNTVAGMGKDIAKAGDTIENAAKKK